MKKLLLIIGLYTINGTVFARTCLPVGSEITAKFDSGISLFKNITPAEPTTLSISIITPMNIIDNKLTDCKAITSAYPDFSSNRIMIKMNKISCNGRDIDIQGYVVGVDGKAGIPNSGTEKNQIDISPNTMMKIVTLIQLSYRN